MYGTTSTNPPHANRSQAPLTPRNTSLPPYTFKVGAGAVLESVALRSDPNAPSSSRRALDRTLGDLSACFCNVAYTCSLNLARADENKESNTHKYTFREMRTTDFDWAKGSHYIMNSIGNSVARDAGSLGATNTLFGERFAETLNIPRNSSKRTFGAANLNRVTATGQV